MITELGDGGYGCVYKVKHKIDGKIYALKKVILTRKADSEVKALAQLEHPNIPDNILFGADGKVKIGDFGLVAAQTDQNGDPIERSKRKGTPPYMSPEQENKKNYDEKTDIFPLGLIWFEMLWKISTGMERVKLWSDLRNQRFPEGFSDKYSAESTFIMKMLSYSPEDRPHAKDIKGDLQTFFSLEHDVLSQRTI
ncbi:hypothetical protein cypCar_00048805 [Cyprinus carpio]|nr:hypothetical protein cypCar_00048805 [Cyprinus carpio]